jgi:response regulator of citrate/malate metabolism
VNITISIVEDDAPVRDVLTEWIRGADGFKCVGVHPNCVTAGGAESQRIFISTADSSGGYFIGACANG